MTPFKQILTCGTVISLTFATLAAPASAFHFGFGGGGGGRGFGGGIGHIVPIQSDIQSQPQPQPEYTQYEPRSVQRRLARPHQRQAKQRVHQPAFAATRTMHVTQIPRSAPVLSQPQVAVAPKAQGITVPPVPVVAAPVIAAPVVAAAAPPATPPAVAVETRVPDQGRRVALVIGNSAYQSVARLGNPNEDAEAVASTFRSMGFNSVKLVEDVTLQQMKDAMRDFQAQADTADWAVVYYAGHGIEVSGQNYLIPVDAHLKSDQDAEDEAVTLRYVLEKMHNARKLRLVILDACRENPFQGIMKRQLASRAVPRGLAPYEPRVANEMVVFAAKDGEQAQDGTGSHSPFAQALVARMSMPKVEINKVFRLVTADVLTATNNRQQPFVYGSTPGEEDFYFQMN